MYALLLLLSLVATTTAVSTTLLKQMFSSSSTPTMTGDLTYYGGTTGGNCGYLNHINEIGWSSALTSIAMNAIQYAGNDESQGCGVCIKYAGTGTGSGASSSKPSTSSYTTAIVTDQCPECAKGSIDIGKSGDGRWGVKWYAIPCPVGSAKIYYQFQGSNDYYIKMQVIGTKLPVIAMSFQSSGGSTVSGTRTQDNYFTASASFKYPLSVKVTASNGEVVTITGVTSAQVKTTGTKYASTVQFVGTSFGEEDVSAQGADSNVTLAVVLGVLCALLVVVGVIIALVVRKRRQTETV